MNECIFCRIAQGSIKASVVHEDERVIAFRDIEPQAPVHIIIIPKKHIESIDSLDESDFPYIEAAVKAASEIAKREGVSDSGYRLVTNHGKNGGQSVFHLHFHLLGGREMKWPPG